MNSHLQLKNRIKKLRFEKGLTQTQLAEKCKTTQNTISSIETGQYSPSAFLAGIICAALDCKFEDCFYYEMTEEK